MTNWATKSFKPIFLQLLFLNPFSNVESKTSIIPPEQHVGRTATSSGLSSNLVRNKSKSSQKASSWGKIMRSKSFKSFIFLEKIDKNNRWRNKQYFIRRYKPNMQNRLIQRFLPLNNFSFSRTVIYSKFEFYRLIVIHSFFISVVIIITQCHIMFKCSESDYCLVS